MNQGVTKNWCSDSAAPDGQPSSPRPSLADRLKAGQLDLDWYVKRSRVYRSWRMMQGRCSPKACHSNRKKYYDKGIRIHPDFEDFWKFFAELGERQLDESLARHDDAKDFEPGNCYWLPARVRVNERVRAQALKYLWKGKQHSEHQLAKALGVDRHHIVQMRIAGGIDVIVSETAVLCLDALQTNRIVYQGVTSTLLQWADKLHCHVSLLRFRLRKGMLPTTIIEGLSRHGEQNFTSVFAVE